MPNSVKYIKKSILYRNTKYFIFNILMLKLNYVYNIITLSHNKNDKNEIL